VDDITDLNVNTLTNVGNIHVGGFISAPNQPAFRAYPSADDTINGTSTLPKTQSMFLVFGYFLGLVVW
jgi:hypothetical protein